MKQKLVLIDADSLIFYSSKDTIEESIQSMKNRIYSIVEKTNSDAFILFLTGATNFRYELYPEYKSGRKKVKNKPAKKPLKYIKTLKAFLLEEYRACLVEGLEADDLVVYYNYNIIPKSYVTCISSPDKDVLNQVIGEHYNYGKDEFIEILDQKQVDRFRAFQLLVGDVTDSIPGIVNRTKYMRETYGLDKREGVGEVTANKILNLIDHKGGHYASEILNCYISKYGSVKLDPVAREKGFEDYTLNRRLLHLDGNQIPEYKILQNYDIENHINVINDTDAEEKIINDEIDEF